MTKFIVDIFHILPRESTFSNHSLKVFPNLISLFDIYFLPYKIPMSILHELEIETMLLPMFNSITYERCTQASFPRLFFYLRYTFYLYKSRRMRANSNCVSLLLERSRIRNSLFYCIIYPKMKMNIICNKIILMLV